MAGKGEGRRGRRGRWLLLAALLGCAAWIIRSRRAAAAADIGTGWPPPRPAGAGAEWRLPGTDGAPQAPGRASDGNGAGPASTNAPAPDARPTPVAAATATRRPSPRPRTAAPAAAAPDAAAPAQDGRPRAAVAARPDGSAPGPEYTIKGNAGSMLFHTPESPYYGRTRAEYWFRTADDARAAGFTEWTPRRR
ncbi:sunset domain-containing protein [Pseudonocardia sichuanensis]